MGGENPGGLGGHDAWGSGAAVGTGGTESAAGGRYSGLGGTFFDGGTRVEIPFQGRDVRLFFTPDLNGVSGPPFELEAPRLRIVDGPGYSPQHVFSIDLPYLFDEERCSRVGYGHFELDAFAVEEDLDSSHAALSIERSGETLTLIHEGLGRHRFEAQGRFIPDRPDGCLGLLDEDQEVPIMFGADIVIEEASGVRLEFEEDCGDEIKALSGQPLSGKTLVLLDGEGKSFYPENVDPSYPVTMFVETERAAEVNAPQGIARTVTVSGEPQLVRLSTPYGPLAIYELVVPSQVDDWTVQFWVTGAHGFLPRDIESGETYPGGAFTAYEYGADVRLMANGTPICSMAPGEAFLTTSLTPEVCGAVSGAPQVYPIAELVEAYGTCELELAYPDAKGGEGITADLTVTWVEE